MSATGRNLPGKERYPDDAYMTPAWCVTRFIESGALSTEVLQHGKKLEPCAGMGAIPAAIGGTDWTLVEKRAECELALLRAEGSLVRCPWDFFEWHPQDRYALAITNPPFKRAMEFYARCRDVADHTVLFLRLNILGGDARSYVFREDAPDVYVLPNRPSFSKDGGTDATEYAWMHWGPERKQHGRITVLRPTPLDERRAGWSVRALAVHEEP